MALKIKVYIEASLKMKCYQCCKCIRYIKQKCMLHSTALKYFRSQEKACHLQVWLFSILKAHMSLLDFK